MYNKWQPLLPPPADPMTLIIIIVVVVVPSYHYIIYCRRLRSRSNYIRNGFVYIHVATTHVVAGTDKLRIFSFFFAYPRNESCIYLCTRNLVTTTTCTRQIYRSTTSAASRLWSVILRRIRLCFAQRFFYIFFYTVDPKRLEETLVSRW